MGETFYVNETLEWLPSENNSEHGIERILWVHPKQERFIVIKLSDKSALPFCREAEELAYAFQEGLIRRCEVTFTSALLSDNEISENNRARRDRAWEIIKDLVCDEPLIYDKKYRGKAIAELLDKYKTEKTTIYKYLRKYWQGGKTINSLLPDYYNCGGRGKERIENGGPKKGRKSKEAKLNPEAEGINLNEEIKRKFRSGIKLYGDNRQNKPSKKVYKDIIRHLFNIGYRIENGVEIPIIPPLNELPTYGQFKYFYEKERDLEKSLIATQGERKFNLKHRHILGESTHEAFGPGSIFQIDATIGDIYLVHRYNRLWLIGRPIIYLIIDVFSRLIAGLYVGLEGPSWLGAMMALANAAEDKVEFCAKYGISIDSKQWPCSQLPERLITDRGPEYMGDKPIHLRNTLKVMIQNLPPYRADWKGIVERHFRISNDKLIRWLPGAVNARYQERGERDYRFDALLDIDQFTKLMIQLVLYYNNSHWMEWYSRDEFQISDEVEPYPVKLWEWGIRNRNGHLNSFSKDIIRLNLMPSDQATVTHKGIIFNDMSYGCEQALEEQWYLHARKRSWRVPISYDPRLTDYIYIRSSDGMSFTKCTLLESQSRYKNKRIEEVTDLLAYEQLLKNEAHNESGLQAEIELDSKVDHIVNEAKSMRGSTSGMSKKSRLDGIRDNRKDEKENKRSEEGMELGAPSIPKNNNTKVLSFPYNAEGQAQNEDDKDYVAPPNYYELLQKTVRRKLDDEK